MPRPCALKYPSRFREPCCIGECEYVDRLGELYAAGEDLTPGDQAAEADRAAEHEQDRRDRAWGAAHPTTRSRRD